MTREEVLFDREYIFATRYMIYRDTVLIVCNKDNSGDNLLEIYNMNNGELFNSYFLKGRGPGELLSARWFLNGGTLIVDDFQRNQIAFVELDRVLADSNYIPKLDNYDPDVPTINRTVDGRMLMLNPYAYYDDVKKVGNKNQPRFIIADFNKAVPEIQYTYDTYNMAGGYILTNYEKNRICFASSSQAEMEIYDGDLNLLNKAFGPDKFDVQYHVGEAMLDYYNGSPVSYSGVCATQDNLFLIYYGNLLKIGTKRRQWNPLVLVFDWDGDFVKSYQLDKYAFNPSISLDGKTLYVTGYDNMNLPKLYKYNLE